MDANKTVGNSMDHEGDVELTSAMSNAPAKAALKFGVALVAFGAFLVPVAQLMAQATAPGGAVDGTRIEKGREIFTSWGCAGCHSLADAKAGGDVGPPLDGREMTEAFVVNRVTNGQGAMPTFGGQLTEQEIADLAYYIVKVSKH